MSQKYLLVKSLFCPNLHYYNISIKSLVKTTLLLSNIQYDVLCVGWIHKYSDMFKTFVKMYSLPGLKTDLWTVNYGKYKIMNTVIDNSHDYDYIIYLDHDIYFDFCSIKLISSLSQVFHNYDVDLIAFNHKHDVRHHPHIYENNIIINGFTLLWSNTPGAIACGAYMVSCKKLCQIQPFPLKSIYGLDDYYLTSVMNSVVVENIYVVHPFDENQKYNEWKKQNIIGMINNAIDFYTNMENANNLWLS